MGCSLVLRAPIGAVDAHGASQHAFLFGNGFDVDLPDIKTNALGMQGVEKVNHSVEIAAPLAGHIYLIQGADLLFGSRHGLGEVEAVLVDPG